MQIPVLAACFILLTLFSTKKFTVDATPGTKDWIKKLFSTENVTASSTVLDAFPYQDDTILHHTNAMTSMGKATRENSPDADTSHHTLAELFPDQDNDYNASNSMRAGKPIVFSDTIEWVVTEPSYFPYATSQEVTFELLQPVRIMPQHHFVLFSSLDLELNYYRLLGRQLPLSRYLEQHKEVRGIPQRWASIRPKIYIVFDVEVDVDDRGCLQHIAKFSCDSIETTIDSKRHNFHSDDITLSGRSVQRKHVEVDLSTFRKDVECYISLEPILSLDKNNAMMTTCKIKVLKALKVYNKT